MLIEDGEIVRFTVGSGYGLTATFTAFVTDPPGPVQVMPYEKFPVLAGVKVALPLDALDPLHAPVALHAVTLTPLHVTVVVLPTYIDVGDAVSVSVGEGGDATVTVAVFEMDPPLPVQVRT
jgi:hypothetical protein